MSRTFTTQTDLEITVCESGVVAVDGFTISLTHHDMGRLAAALDEVRRQRAHDLKVGNLEPLDGEIC